MKKSFKTFSLLGLILLFVVLLTACGGSTTEETTSAQKETNESSTEETKPSNEEVDTVKPLNITLAGGSAGGSWSAIGEGIGETIRRYAPGSTFSYEPGQDGANAASVAQGNVPLGMAHSPIVALALKGEEPFKQPLDNIRVVASLYPATLQVAVRDDVSFTSIEEIVQNKIPVRVSMNKKGTIQNLISEMMFGNYGVSPEDIESWGGQVVYTSSGDSMDMIRDDRLDMYITTAKAGETYFVETNLTVPLRLIQLSDELLQKIEETYGMPQEIIPADSYDFLNEDYKSVELYSQLISSADVDEELVYNVTKAMIDNLDYLHTIHDALSDLTPESASKVGTIPLHPGAEKLYKELGVMK